LLIRKKVVDQAKTFRIREKGADQVKGPDPGEKVLDMANKYRIQQTSFGSAKTSSGYDRRGPDPVKNFRIQQKDLNPANS
jgi:hypothetical protein